MKPLVLLSFIFAFFSSCTQKVVPSQPATLGPLFQNHLVLQRDSPTSIWGKGIPQAEVSIQFLGKNYSAKIQKDSTWKISLPPQKASGPHSLYFHNGQATDTLNDIYFGDVWLCAGQSNMGFKLEKEMKAAKEIPLANHPSIRHFKVSLPGKETEFSDKWQVCSPEVAGQFSAAAYYFAENLQPEIDVPIGLIVTTAGSSRIEAWMRKGNDEIDSTQTSDLNLFKNLVKPLASFPLKGVLWYQGESNGSTEDARRYRTQFQALISDWRTQLNQPELPWIFTQLPAWFFKSEEVDWAELRASQAAALELPFTSMVATYDFGNSKDLHPNNKHELGRRYALVARRLVYGENILASGPFFRSAKKEGQKIQIAFDYCENGLSIRPPSESLNGFEIAGKDGKFFPAEARIEGEEVVIESKKIKDPVSVRYAWKTDISEANLSNAEGWPALPFWEEVE